MNDINDERLGREKRKHVRIEVELKAHFTIEEDEEKTIYHAKTKNMSHNGVCLRVYRYKNELLKKIGNDMPRLKVSIDISDENERIDAYTKTAWISSRLGWMVQPKDERSPILMGMEFTNYEKADEDKLNGFIADLLIKKRDSIYD